MSHRSSKSTSFAAIGATLVPTIITSVAFLTAFVLIRKRYRNIYAPRTYFKSVPDKDRTPSSSRTAVSWYHDFLALDDKFVLRHSSLDGYLFLRFLRIIVLICFVGCCLTWPILFPINATSNGGATQLDRISFSNLGDQPNKMYAHAVVAWIFLAFVVFVVNRERIFVIGLRQASITTQVNQSRLSSRVVLFLSVPNEAIEEEALQQYFGSDAKRGWKVSNLDELQKAVAGRSDNVSLLESSELKFQKNKAKEYRQTGNNMQSRRDGANGQGPKSSDDTTRPQHRSTFLIGNKIDSIDSTRKALRDDINRIQTLREEESQKSMQSSNAIFVEFKDQASAHQAYQTVLCQSPLQFQPRYIGLQPKEVLWSNLTVEASLRVTYSYLSIALVIATIIFWSIPVGIVGTLSNINNLTDKFHFLGFVDNLPSPILGLLTGFVPSLILSTFVSYVPKFFRYIAKLSGQPTTAEAERLTQIWYFAFQVIQVFLVTTFSSGAAAVATKIANDPASVPTLLAKNLPKASNFYISYFILQGFASSAKNVINYSDLFEYLFYDRFIDKTPRDKYTRRSKMKGISWGSVYPKFTNFAVIAIAYSCIAPIMLGFATVGLFLFYLSYRYNLLYVIQVKVDTRGQGYSRALQHLLTGVYLSELCLIGLFGIHDATGPLILMVLLLIATIIHHIIVNKFLVPLEKFIPLDALSSQDEEQPLLSNERDSFDDRGDHSSRSRVIRLGAGKLPPVLLDPLAVFLEPHIFASQESLRPWLEDPTDDSGDVQQLKEEEVKNAYTNPAMTSKTPKVWLAQDPNGISTLEKEANESAGLSTTDEGARLNEDNKVEWDKDDFSKVPIFKLATQY